MENVFLFGILLSLAISNSFCRQMCYSCSYNPHPLKTGYDCVTNPKNWTVGDWRMKCPNRCTSTSHYNKESGEASYFYRGCSGGDDVPEDGCTEDDFKYYCYFSCTGHYCNDGPAMDEAMLEEIEVPGQAPAIFISATWTLLCVTLLFVI